MENHSLNDLYIVTYSEQTKLFTAWVRVEKGFFIRTAKYVKLNSFESKEKAWEEILAYDSDER